MFLRNDKPDPKQQALDNVLMMLVHKKMSAPVQSKRSMKPSYPPARDGKLNFEPGFTPNPTKSRKQPFDMSKIQAVLAAAGGTGQGMFNPQVQLDPSQVQDMRGDLNPQKAVDDRLMMLKDRGAFAGDGSTERPAPGGSGRDALIQMLMQRMKSGSFLR